MNLGDIHDLVRKALARGTSEDSAIPSRVEMAVRWLERNSTFKWMERFTTLETKPDAAQPRAISMPNRLVKSIRFLRRVDPDGAYYRYDQMDPATMSGLTTEPGAANPDSIGGGFWLDGLSYLYLSHPVTAVYSFEFAWISYSDWNKSDENLQNPVIDRAADFLVAQAMIYFTADKVDSERQAIWRAIRDEALVGLHGADQELVESERESVMRYRPYG